MKKTFIALLIFALSFSVVSSGAFAKESKKVYSESQLNVILTKAGVPQEVLEGMDLDQKRFIIENSGEDLKFVNATTDNFVRNPETDELVKINTNIISPYANIPSTDLSLSMQHFSVNYNGVPMDDIYTSFEWLRSGKGPGSSPDGVYRDSIGIAVPDGWEIQSGKYSCAVAAWVINAWGNPISANCNNGQPTEYSLYGASWEFSFNQGLTGYNTNYKGTAKLTMKKKSSSAINRAVSKYNEAKNNAFGNFTFTVGWGPASITYTPSAGSNNTASTDLTW